MSDKYIDVESLFKASEYLESINHIWAKNIRMSAERIVVHRKSTLKSKNKELALKKRKGLCRSCGHPIKLPNTRCEKCLDVQRKNNLKRRQILKANGICTRCNTPLLPNMDSGYITCLNCRERRA